MLKLFSLSILSIMLTSSNTHANFYQPLEKAPTSIEKYNEIAITYDPNISTLFNQLSSEERVFMYYLFRASLPGNRIFADQLHRDSVETTELFEYILQNAKKLKDNASRLKPFPLDEFLQEANLFLIYLWSNHGQYFLREFVNHKRTPSSLNLPNLNQQNLIYVLEFLKFENAKEIVENLSTSIFEKDQEPTLTVPGNLEKSAVNIYSKDFLEEDFASLPSEKQTHLNAYYFVETVGGKRFPKAQIYRMGGKYNQELSVSYYWLNKAYEYAKEHPKYFDEHLVASLHDLLLFIETGDEKYFKMHSIEWLKSNSRVDFVFGFIETYHDPKLYRGSFQAEATIKNLNMNTLKAILPEIEAKLPFPADFRRKDAKIPNVSINTQTFATGDLGPMKTVAAYCLPNYDEIRSEHGSKQIIFAQEPSLGQQLNPKLSKTLFYLPEDKAWHEKYDPDFEIPRDIWTLQVLLHETIGHGSGKYHHHVFCEGEDLNFDGKTYQVGDKIAVTSTNIQKFLSPYSATLEELRAEILALYTSVEHYDELTKIELLNKWSTKIDKKKMLELMILNMTKTGLNRLFQQPIDAKKITGDHARANYTILNYLLEGGGLELIEESVEIDSKHYKVIGLKITDLKKVRENIKKLAILVQSIKSTGNGKLGKKLIETYGVNIIDPEHVKIIHTNNKAVIGDIKATAKIFPKFLPIKDPKTHQIIDVEAIWPKSFVDQQLYYAKKQLSTE